MNEVLEKSITIPQNEDLSQNELPDQITEILEIEFRTEEMRPYHVSDEDIKGMITEYESQIRHDVGRISEKVQKW